MSSHADLMPMQVDLIRYVDREPGQPDYLTWQAVWGVWGQRQGFESAECELRDLIDLVVEDARRWAAGGEDELTPREGVDMTELRICWTVGGEAPGGQTVTAAIAATGITLPTTATEWEKEKARNSHRDLE